MILCPRPQFILNCNWLEDWLVQWYTGPMNNLPTWLKAGFPVSRNHQIGRIPICPKKSSARGIQRPMRFLFLCVMLGAVAPTAAQQPPNPNYVRIPIFASYDDFRTELLRITSLDDATQRQQEMDQFWQQLQDAGQVPYAQDDRVALMYRTSAASANIFWPGDANGWNPNNSAWKGARLGDSDVYLLEKTLPRDTRVDYKIVVNGNWQLDPANPLLMWGGFGPNNELRMPEYVFPQETVYRNDVDHGSLSDNIRISSTRLNYDLQYRVYTPPHVESLSGLPTIYITDGHEYAVDYLGATVNVLDNLIADRQLKPAIAIFIDPRNPDNLGQNRRAEQYVTNEDFAAFVADELVPVIDGAYPTSAAAEERTILGTSLGGLNAAFFGATRSDVFRNLGIQSPAFSADPSIYNLLRDEQLADQLRIYMTTGTMSDNGGATTMAPILSSFGYDYTFVTVNEGHSWGSWRGQLDDIFKSLVGTPVPEPQHPVGLVPGSMLVAAILLSSRRQPLTSNPRSSQRGGGG